MSWLKYFSEVNFVLTKSDPQTSYGDVDKDKRKMREKKKDGHFNKDQVKASFSNSAFI